LGVALGVGAAGVIQQTGVDALAVAAGFSILAFGIRLTSDRFAFDLRIADGSFRALTDGSVVGEEAVCALAAVARVHADPVDTRGIFFAFVIANATWGISRFNRHATSVRIRNPSFPARTNHCPEGNRVHDRADGGGGAGAQLEAGVLTFVVQAGPAGRTFGIDLAFVFRFHWKWRALWRAGDKRVANVTWWAGARRHVVGRCADGRWRAHVVEEAGVHAVVLDASAVRRAVGVDVALHGLASDEGIADKSWWTFAVGSVICS
jgi:hypothetical protein